MGLKRIGSWIVGVLVLAAAGYAVYHYQFAKPESPLQYETAKVDRGSIVARVTATGTLSALVTVQVGSQVSGRIQKLFVDFNSPVKKGEVIAKIDPALFEAAYEQAKANYLAAKSNLEKSKVQAVDAKRQYDRSKQLRERKLIAQADLDTAQTTYEAAQAQVGASQGSVEQAQASLHQAEVNLAYTTIVSPINGVVISRNVDVGQTVAASLQAPTLFLIAEDLRKMQVDTSVAEADIGRLAAGMPAMFTVDAYPSERFQGKVREVRNAPQTVQNVVTYDAVIDIDNPELKLKPGMTANVTFVYAERHDVLRVRNAALRFRPPQELLSNLGIGTGGALGNGTAREGGTRTGGPRGGTGQTLQKPATPANPDERTVWVLRNGKPVQVTIRTGITDGSFTEVLGGGLTAGDLLITDVSGGPAAGARSTAAGGFRRMF
jgi:HlyD family secretion protein